MSLLIVILNYRTPALTLNCLQSIAGVLDEAPGMRVVVVDNGSGDDSPRAIEDAIRINHWPWCELMELPQNLGFAAGNNRGFERLKTSDCEWVLVLNSDTIVLPGTLRRSHEVMRADPRIGMMSCRLLNADHSTQNCTRPFPSPIRMILCALGLPWLLPRQFGWADVYDVPVTMLNQKRDCDWIIGAYMFIRRASLEQVGGFDTDFFFYGEDIELCHRFRAAGWRVHYDPAAAIVHLGGGSENLSRAAATGRELHMRQARYLVQRKCYGVFWEHTVRAADRLAAALRKLKARLKGP